jgi:hypothetical protein
LTKKEPVMSDLFASAVTGRNETTGQAGSFGKDPREKTFREQARIQTWREGGEPKC